MMPRMSSSRMIRNMSPSILISVPPYFEISTLSPFFTVKSTFLPSSFTLPVPRATTLPSCGFSLAVSGIMIPPFFTSVSSSGCTSTRSPRGLTLTFAISYLVFLVVLLLGRTTPNAFGVAGKLVISSCLRRRLRTPHRRRRHHASHLHLAAARRDAIASRGRLRVEDRLVHLGPRTPACKVPH